MDSDTYFHGYSPLTIRWALHAHAGLKGIWAFMAGSPLNYPEKWEPYRAVLNTAGNYSMGIDTSLGRTGASRVLHAFFGDADLEGADFSGADLRGADFAGARLLAASFCTSHRPAP